MLLSPIMDRRQFLKVSGGTAMYLATPRILYGAELGSNRVNIAQVVNFLEENKSESTNIHPPVIERKYGREIKPGMSYSLEYNPPANGGGGVFGFVVDYNKGRRIDLKDGYGNSLDGNLDSAVIEDDKKNEKYELDFVRNVGTLAKPHSTMVQEQRKVRQLSPKELAELRAELQGLYQQISLDMLSKSRKK